jgi:hypothetical protein
MAKPNSLFEAEAAEAAARIDAARAAGAQLTFLPDEPGAPGRTPRGKGKATSQMREWLASRGYRMPEDVLAEMAGLTSREDVLLAAMAMTERVLGWAESGGRDVVQVLKDGVLIEKELDNRATTGQRLQTFQFVYTACLRAAEALLPFGLAKLTPDTPPPAAVQVTVFGGAAQAGPQPGVGPDQARDVTPRPGRLAPPPMPVKIVQDQGLAPSEDAGADGAARTEGATS